MLPRWFLTLIGAGLVFPDDGCLAAVSMLEQAVHAVSALPDQSREDQAKRAVLEIALERASASADAGMQDKTSALLADVRAAIALPSSNMARQATTDAAHISAIKPVPYTANNPYLEALTAWGRHMLAKPEPPWPRATATQVVMKDLSPRVIGEEIRTCIWLYANPASPLRGNGDLLKRLLRRCHAFIDAANLNREPSTKAQTQIYDQFATEAGISGLVEFISLYPGLLLPSQRAEWDSGLQAAFDKLWPEMKRADNWNLNIETARMVAMLHLGYYYDNPEVIAKVNRHVDVTLSKMKPDGAFPYNGDSNPSCNYHGAILGSLSRIHDISGRKSLAAGLAATQWKGPVMGRTDEFWTSPFHKTYRWNYQRGTEKANQLVVTLSRNPYANFLRGKFGGPDRDSVAWYRPNIPSKPMPDNYTVVDRNVDGPRAWYGRFNYVCVVEVRPIWAKDEAKVVSTCDDRLLTLHASIGNRRWHVVFNAGDSDAIVTLPGSSGAPLPSSLRISGIRMGLPTRKFEPRFGLAPSQLAVLIESADPVDHLPGWESFEAMIQHHP